MFDTVMSYGDVLEPIIIDHVSFPPEEAIEPVAPVLLPSVSATFEIRFSEGTHSTRSALTDSFICALPCIKCIGGRPINTTHRLIDLDTDEILCEYFWGTFPDKWLYRFSSLNPYVKLGYMPDHDYHLRFEIEYEDGTKTHKDITIINGPPSGMNPISVGSLDCPSNVDAGEHVWIRTTIKNVGDEAGRVGTISTGWRFPNQVFLFLRDCLPTDPEFNSFTFSIGSTAWAFNHYIKAYSLESIDGIGWTDPRLSDEKTIICNDPTDCSGGLDESSCYDQPGIPRQGCCCYWDNGCGPPNKDCMSMQSYVTQCQEPSGFPGLLPYDARVDFNEDGVVDFDDLVLLSRSGIGLKIIYNCNPDITLYSEEARAGLGLKVSLIDCTIDESVDINKPTVVSATGKVVADGVVNPAVGILYYDGPSDTIIYKGQEIAKGEIVSEVIQGTVPKDTEILITGDIFYPEKGEYTIWGIAGVMKLD